MTKKHKNRPLLHTSTSLRLWKNVLVISVLFSLVCCVTIGCIFYAAKTKDQTTENQTNPIYAEIALKNLAVGMRTYSVMKGGGGNTMFTGDISNIKEYVMQDAFQAMKGEKQIPYNGYVFELKENPTGDNFQNNFRFEAHPSNGFVGQAFQIDKYEQIEPLN